MSDLATALQRIISENRAARERDSVRVSRLIDATANGDNEAFRDVLNEITTGDSSEALAEHDQAQSVVGDTGDEESGSGG